MAAKIAPKATQVNRISILKSKKSKSTKKQSPARSKAQALATARKIKISCKKTTISSPANNLTMISCKKHSNSTVKRDCQFLFSRFIRMM